MAQRGRPPHPDILTPREQEVLALLREGLSNPEIADRLNITRETAKTHVSQIIAKLGVTTREEAAAWRPDEAPPEAPPRRPRWQSLLAPLTLAKAAGIAAACAALAGLAMLAWGVLRTSDDPGSAVAEATRTSLTTPLPSAAENETPEPETLAYSNFPWRRALYAVNPQSGDAQVLIDLPPRTYDWSTNGSEIAYVGSYNDTEMRIIGASGETVRTIGLSPLTHVDTLKWSPDGKHIVFTATSLGPAMGPGSAPGQLVDVPAIAVLNLDDEEVSVLCQSWGGECGRSGDWFPDSTSFLVSRPGAGAEPPAAVAMGLDGNTRLLAHGWYQQVSSDGAYLVGESGVISSIGDGISAPLTASYAETLSPDGTMLLYQTYEGGQHIRIVHRDGSNDRPLAEGEGYAWSQDSQRIAFIRGGNLYVVNRDGSGEQQITDSPLPLASAPDWAPDGRILFAYAKEPAETRLVAPDGTRRTVLVPGGGPVWSNDGQHIAFSAAAVNVSGGTVYVTGRDGSGIVNLPASVYSSDACVTPLGCQPCPDRIYWSPLNTSILFCNQEGLIARVSPDGASPAVPIVRGFSPTWAPDGTRFAYSVEEPTALPGSSLKIYITEPSEEATRAPFADGYGPSWSPAGDQIAYINDGTLYVRNVTGGDPRRLATVKAGPGQFPSPAVWSADGTAIAYNVGASLFVLKLDHAEDPTLIGEGLAPSWSPDGARITFYSGSSGEALWVAPADGSQKPNRLGSGYSPRWSPDGGLIAYTSFQP